MAVVVVVAVRNARMAHCKLNTELENCTGLRIEAPPTVWHISTSDLDF